MPSIVETELMGEALFESIIQARQEFLAGFKRNGRHHLSCRYEGKVLTVFRRGAGYAWCILDGTRPRYSMTKYQDEDDAISALASELWVGE